MRQQVNITTARPLQKHPKIRQTKCYPSVVISVSTDEGDKITPSLLVHGRYKASALMWHSNLTKQCKKCYLYRHPEEGCKAIHHSCPNCASEHRLKEHKYLSSTCPKKGSRKIIADCCPITLSKCAACGGSPISKKNNLHPAASYAPYELDAAGTYIVNSSFGYGRLCSFRQDAKAYVRMNWAQKAMSGRTGCSPTQFTQQPCP